MRDRGTIYWPGVMLVFLSIGAIVLTVIGIETGVFSGPPPATVAETGSPPSTFHIIPIAAVLALLIAPIMSIVKRTDGESE